MSIEVRITTVETSDGDRFKVEHLHTDDAVIVHTDETMNSMVEQLTDAIEEY